MSRLYLPKHNKLLTYYFQNAYPKSKHTRNYDKLVFLFNYQLSRLEVFLKAKCVKVNPDTPQKQVRFLTLNGQFKFLLLLYICFSYILCLRVREKKESNVDLSFKKFIKTYTLHHALVEHTLKLGHEGAYPAITDCNVQIIKDKN